MGVIWGCEIAEAEKFELECPEPEGTGVEPQPLSSAILVKMSAARLIMNSSYHIIPKRALHTT